MPPEFSHAKPGSAGRPSQHVEIKVVDEDGAEVPVDVDGEILVRAPSVTPGYWADPQLTEEMIVDGFIATGDMGHFDDDGFLYVSGRKDDMIISGGMNIFPAEIEDVLCTRAGVEDAAVIGLPDSKWGEVVCAVVQPTAGAELDADELIEHCYGHLAGLQEAEPGPPGRGDPAHRRRQAAEVPPARAARRPMTVASNSCAARGPRAGWTRVGRHR